MSNAAQDPYTEKSAVEGSVDRIVSELKTALGQIHTAMLTTRAPDNDSLHSRSMAPASYKGLEFCFIGNRASGKFDGIKKDETVNVSFCADGGTWISIAGKATVSNDREKIRELYNPLFRAWFGDSGKPNQKGDAEDERMQLIIVQPDEIRLFANKRTTVGKAIEVVTSAVSGDTAEPGEFFVLNGPQLTKAKGLMQ